MLDKPEEANNIECDTRFKTSNSILVAKKKKKYWKILIGVVNMSTFSNKKGNFFIRQRVFFLNK